MPWNGYIGPPPEDIARVLALVFISFWGTFSLLFIKADNHRLEKEAPIK
jgi:hypothetical protein